jgi:hypothetical protein
MIVYWLFDGMIRKIVLAEGNQKDSDLFEDIEVSMTK